MPAKGGTPNQTDKVLKELRQIKNLLMLSLLMAGATSEEVNYATGMGAANIRALLPIKRGRKKGKTTTGAKQATESGT
jgi:hypothetical protein